MGPDIWHLVEGVILAGLGAWVSWVQRRSAKIFSLELRVVTLETEAKAQDATLRRVEDGLKDVQEHMLRRSDLEFLRLKS